LEVIAVVVSVEFTVVLRSAIFVAVMRVNAAVRLNEAILVIASIFSVAIRFAFVAVVVYMVAFFMFGITLRYRVEIAVAGMRVDMREAAA